MLSKLSSYQLKVNYYNYNLLMYVPQSKKITVDSQKIEKDINEYHCGKSAIL